MSVRGAELLRELSLTAERLLFTTVLGLELQAAHVVHIVDQRNHVMAQHVCRVKSSIDRHLCHRAQTW